MEKEILLTWVFESELWAGLGFDQEKTLHAASSHFLLSTKLQYN